MLQNRKSKLAGSSDKMSSLDTEEQGLPSAIAIPPLPETGAARIGADLRAARLRNGWTLEDVADGLRIRLVYLKALEAGDTAILPTGAYAIGFLRTYGNALGMDIDELSRRFRAAATETQKKPDLAFPVPAPERGIPALVMVLFGGLLLIGAYAVWYRLSSDGRLPAEMPVQAAAPANPARPAGGEPPTPAVAPLAPAAPATPPPAAVANNAVTPPAATAPAPQAVSPGSASAMAAQLPPTAPPGPPPITAILAPQPPAPPAPVLDASHISLHAKGNLWVMVKDKDGNQILNRTLHQGDIWHAPAKPDMTMTLGNASMADLQIDGVSAPGFAASALPRKDLPLDATMIRQGKLTGQLQPGETPPAPHLPPVHPASHTTAITHPASTSPAGNTTSTQAGTQPN